MIPSPEAETPSPDSRAGRAYWDAVWSEAPLVEPVIPSAIPLWDDPTRTFHHAFQETFTSRSTNGERLLEIGAANSRWLPYFARQFGFSVTGLDYSADGCAQGHEVLARAGVQGAIICGDALTPPPDLLESFDVVVSFGVVEHFEDTSAAIRAFARYLRSGGILVTIVPNLTGSIGWLVKRLNRPVWDLHVPLSASDVATAHERAGLKVVEARYLGTSNFAVVNFNGKDPRALGTRFGRAVVNALFRVSELGWLCDRAGAPIPETRLFSPYVYCVARCSA